MLHVIAYDIAHPRRLRLVAALCEDFGVRVQKSVFECWLEEDRFEEFWKKLCSIIRRREDFLICYTLDAKAVRQRRRAGDKVVLSERPASRVF